MLRLDWRGHHRARKAPGMENNSEAKPLAQIERHSYSEVGWISRQIPSPSGRGRTFFLTSLFIELIDDRRDFAAGQPQVRLKLAAADRSCTSRAGWPIHEVEHVIEGRGQPVDVLAIERCDECLVEFRDNRPEALWPASTRPVAAGPPDFPGCCAVNARPR